MLAKLPYNQLQQLGLDIWHPKPAKNAPIIPQQIKINARCLVLQFATQPISNPAELKILHGMLGVLELAEHEFMHARVADEKCALSLLHECIYAWSPQFILHLNMDVPSLALENSVQTYSPQYLLQNPKFKASAYKTLLALRANLHDTSN